MRPATWGTCLAVMAIGQSGSYAGINELKHPDWHPSGERLVAEGSCAGNIALYIIELSDGDVRLLFDSEHVDGYPRWFADGKRIAFHQIDAERKSNIATASVSASGAVSDVSIVTEGAFDIEPAPSPDGLRLAYSASGESGQDIVIMDLRNRAQDVWQTSAAENFPSWARDGRSVIYHQAVSGQTQIMRRWIIEDEVEPITGGASPNIVGHLDGSGNLLVFSSERDGDREIYLKNLESGREQRLTDHPGRDGYPKFSPDGNQVAFHSAVEGLGTVIRILDLESGKLKQFAC